jgi:dienelactone hydrolase
VGAMRFVPLALASSLLLAVPAAAQAATVPAGPSGAAFYAPPKPLPGKRHGDLIRARALKGAAVLPGARNELILYRSKGVTGKAVAVSGTVAIPRGEAPKGGWPVITYAHGTTGMADACAPTRDTGQAPVTALNTYIEPLLQRWLKAGYAVVRTDYEGLGTPGLHPYLVGTSEGRSVLDAVRAARAYAPTLSKRVVISGHSQGGHAALWAASLAPNWTPELKIRGTVAFAPASHIGEQAALLRTLTAPSGGLGGLGSIILRGIDVGRPGLAIDRLLTPQAAVLWPQIASVCLPELAAPASFGGLPPAQFLRADADVAPIVAALNANDPETLRVRTPLRIEQGEADTTVFPSFTNQLVAAYQAEHVRLTYKTYPGVSHGDVVNAAAKDATRWIRARAR